VRRGSGIGWRGRRRKKRMEEEEEEEEEEEGLRAWVRDKRQRVT
jgi:hypothetical protein